jgi:hypothetical protein
MTRSGTAPRGGFSRADLTVVLAVGLCLLGLLTPALQGALQKAARETTVNNLKALALALHNHNDTYKRLPPSYGKWPGIKTDATLHVHLLPFVEEAKLYRQYMEQGGGGERDRAVVQGFVAPLDRTNPTPPAGIQNFAGNLLVFGTKAQKFDARARIPGSFTDGTSNTIVLATKYGVCGKGGSRYAAKPDMDTAAFFGEGKAKVKAAPADPTATFQDRPSAKQCLCSPLMAQSYEKEGLLIALADGSTRHLRPDLGPATWNAALTPSGGDILGSDW